MGQTIEKLIDYYRAARGARLEIQKELDVLKESERDLKAQVLAMLDDLKLTSAGGEDFAVCRQKRAIVDVTDWVAFYKHISETGHFDLLQKRPAVRALADRAEEGDKVPGVKLGHFYDLSVKTKGAK